MYSRELFALLASASRDFLVDEQPRARRTHHRYDMVIDSVLVRFRFPIVRPMFSFAGRHLSQGISLPRCRFVSFLCSNQIFNESSTFRRVCVFFRERTFFRWHTRVRARIPTDL